MLDTLLGYAPMVIMALLGLILGKILFSPKPDQSVKRDTSKNDTLDAADTDETYALEWRNRYLAARVKYLEERLSEKSSPKAKAAAKPKAKAAAKPKAKVAAKPKAKAAAKPKAKAAAKPKVKAAAKPKK
ncbi:MAG: hypothetical protein P8Q22_01710 [Hellea sp.]|nr:hypothetical protein [Hellea sp.]